MRVVIANRYQIGAGCSTFVIAEAGVNHNGDPDMARKLVAEFPRILAKGLRVS